MDITEAELINALQAAMAAAPETEGFTTTPELAEVVGWSHQRVRDALRLLIEEQRVEMQWVKRRDIAGRLGRRPAYRLLQDR